MNAKQNPDSNSASFSRREFLQRSAVLAGAALAAPQLLAAAPKRTAADQVFLGQTGVKISRLGLGTGSAGGKVQRDLGQEGFTRLIRYAYDRGLTYIDTAQNYRTHGMVGEAIKGLPREKLFIQTKIPCRAAATPEKVLQTIDQYRRELGVEYLDSLLLHCTQSATWPDDLKRMMDAIAEAQAKKIVRLKGVSCHGLPALQSATTTDWVNVHLVRINPQGCCVDGPTPDMKLPGDMPAAMKEIKAMHAKGRGIIGMKLVGNGTFQNPEDREQAIRYAMNCDCVDAVVIGFGSTAQIDEAIERINRALA
ncbi:MAG: aldo/keto reductase [Verrucomicrobia bacterium]|nr:aldo/keto reductase [Verrucomicrobiota bacterium]